MFLYCFQWSTGVFLSINKDKQIIPFCSIYVLHTGTGVAHNFAALQSNWHTYPYKSHLVLLTVCNSVLKLTLQTSSELLFRHDEEQHFLKLALIIQLTLPYCAVLFIISYSSSVLCICECVRVYVHTMWVLTCPHAQAIPSALFIFFILYPSLCFICCAVAWRCVFVCVFLERLIGIHCSSPPPPAPPHTTSTSKQPHHPPPAQIPSTACWIRLCRHQDVRRI